jgi:cell division protein FtsB
MPSISLVPILASQTRLGRQVKRPGPLAENEDYQRLKARRKGSLEVIEKLNLGKAYPTA